MHSAAGENYLSLGAEVKKKKRGFLSISTFLPFPHEQQTSVLKKKRVHEGLKESGGQIWARGDLSGSHMQLRQVVVLTGEIPPVLHLFTEATDQ